LKNKAVVAARYLQRPSVEQTRMQRFWKRQGEQVGLFKVNRTISKCENSPEALDSNASGLLIYEYAANSEVVKKCNVV
jgi:hypothetical protein